MITLLAESKTMNDTSVFTPDFFQKPLFFDEAAKIMESVSTTPLPELQKRLNLSPGLTAKMQKMALSFGLGQGSSAIDSYSGEVFKALDFDTLDDSGKSFFKKNFRFISSLYGYLKPDDTIISYRLNYDSIPSFPDEKLCVFWKKFCTLSLGKEIQSRGDNILINLLPGDASKYIDWKLIKSMCKIIIPVIKEITSGGKEQTPPAGKLKKIRGLICRNIAGNQINNLDDFLKMELPEVAFSGIFLYPDYPVFYC